jgi:hypothetical protein
MNARHTNVIIELALLDNKQNRERTEVQAQFSLLNPIAFAKSFGSVHVNLGRAAGHSTHARRLWREGAVLVVPTESEVSRLAQGLPAGHPVVASRTAWKHRRHLLAPLLPPGSLIVFDWASDLFECMSHAEIWWPANRHFDHTYLFLG